MSEPARTARDFFDTEYRAYAMYTVEGRAIPSLVDGFKPAQRKIAYAANKLWKRGSEKPMKVFQLGGQAAALAFYHHGSLDATIIGMTQSFKNSMPIFQGVGQFGSLRSPQAGASRYVGVRFNENFRRLYKDFELVTPRQEEGEEIEPAFFLPIIPTVLLNGGSGIAVGFATNILNRHPIDLIDATIDILKRGKTKIELRPWINGFFGEVQTVPEKEGWSWVFHGTYEVLNSTRVEITEIPPSFTYEKYEAHLEKLVEKGTIRKYEDFSADRVRYVVHFHRTRLADLIDDEKLEGVLKMRETQTENITTLAEDGKLKIFQTASELLLYFVDFRLGYYQRRKDRLLKVLSQDIKVLEAKLKFLEAVINGSFKVSDVPKKTLVAQLQAEGYLQVRDSYDYLLAMPLWALTKERHKDLQKKLADKQKELDQIERATPKNMYLKDLRELRKLLVSKGWESPRTQKPKKVKKKARPGKSAAENFVGEGQKSDKDWIDILLGN
jgi:DNA gyrase/topoisomerase IV subunit A